LQGVAHSRLLSFIEADDTDVAALEAVVDELRHEVHNKPGFVRIEEGTSLLLLARHGAIEEHERWPCIDQGTALFFCHAIHQF
jgi:hypothetical protein